MSTIKLQKVIDINVINQIQNSFAKATRMAVYCTSAEGEITDIFSPSAQGEYIGKLKAKPSDESAAQKAMRTGRPTITKQSSGLIEFGVPVTYRGETIGAFAGGRVFAEQPDLSLLKRTASENNFPEQQFVEEMKKVEVIPMSTIEANTEMLFVMLNAINGAAARGGSVVDSSTTGEKIAVAGTKGSLAAIKKMVSDNEKTVAGLNKQIDSINNISREMVQKLDSAKEIVKSIQDIAMNTRILGFNASIEASRSKESGKGFGVIAQEVRNLADVSKQSAELIETEIQNINIANANIHDNLRDSNRATYKILDNFTEVSRLLEGMKEA